MEGTTTTRDKSKDAVSDAPTEPQLLATALGDKCSNCGAAMADDQRYCIECGTRRGKGRYAMVSSGSSSTMVAGGYSSPPRSWLTANSSLLLGVAVLLIAMGVGVLIGRASNSSTPKAGSQVIKIEGSAPASSAPATAPTTTTPSSNSTASSSTPKSNSASSKATSAISSAAHLSAKAKTIPKSLASSVAKTGSKCTTGEKGCTGGKFTGTFFGGGG